MLSLFDALSNSFSAVVTAGTIDKSKDFDAQLSELLTKYSDEYFSEIVVDTLENTISTDGGESVSLEDYGIDYNAIDSPELVIPAVPVLEAAGVEAELTEDGEIEIEGGENISALPENAEIIGEIENGVANAEIDGSVAKVPVGYLNENQAEELNFETHYNEQTSQIIITNPYQSKRLIVNMNSGRTLKNSYGAKESISDDAGRYILQFKSEEETKSALKKLQNNSAVADVCCDEIVSICAAPTLKNRDGAKLINSDRYKQYLADNNKTTKIIVAVVDTGVETSHPFLKDRMVEGYDVYTKKAATSDGNGHGTHVAGIIADNTPENVKIMPVKVLTNAGNGTDLSVAAGIDWAVKNKAKVINMSLGGYCTDDNCPIAQAIRKAYKAGVTVCVAAGNETDDTKNYCPARFKECITVASATIRGGISTFSNYGSSVDIAAPGSEIYSSYKGGKYATLSGTSMACPFAAAAAAMVLINNSSLTPAKVETTLKSYCADMGLVGWDKYSGNGLINMGIALGDNHKSDRFFASMPEGLTMDYSKYGTWYMTELHVDDSENEYLEDYTGAHNYQLVSSSDRTVKTTSSDPKVAIFDGRYIVPKGEGTATIKIWIDGGESREFTLKINAPKAWIDFAADKYAGGKGTKTEPYLISNASQLAKLSLDVRNGKKYSNKYFKITKDIDLKGKMWHSICFVRYDIYALSGFLVSESFEGILDGGNHKIKNMYVFDDPIQRAWGDWNAVNAIWFSEHYGFFGDMEKCTVKNLGIENGYTSNEGGGLLGANIYQNTTIENCYTSGTSGGSGFVGHIMNYNIRFKNCYSSATVLRGGFAHSISSSRTSGGVILSNCFFCGEQMGNDRYNDIGGFTAFFIESQKNEKYTALYNCFSATKTLSGVGFAKSNSYSKLYKCYYLNSNKYGIKSNNNKSQTSLTAKNESFFKTKSSYTNANNWNGSYKWDFTNTWAIDKNVNGGYPYLKKNKPLNITSKNTNTGTWLDYAATKFAGGNGTKDSPYLVSNASQLARIALIYRYGGAKGVYFKLTADIDLKAHPWFTIGGGEYMDSEYSSKYKRKRFFGNIDGANHTIRNMTVEGGDGVGFISVLDLGTVSNLNFENASVSGGTDVGVVCAVEEYRSRITSCLVSATASGRYYVGGIAGRQEKTCIISNCSVEGSVDAKRWSGGIAGSSKTEINASTFKGSVSADEESEMGGICGQCETNSVIRNCSSIGAPLSNAGGAEIFCSYYADNGSATVITYKMGNNVTSKTVPESELLNAETFENWDFENDWSIAQGEYPKPRFYTYRLPILSLPTENWKNYKATSFAGGKGTKSNPYIIATASQLAHIEDVMDGERALYFRQVRDIDLGGKLWNSTYDDGVSVFEFYYDGGGHTIKNLTIKNGMGLFSFMTNGIIANINLTDVKGYSEAALITGCYNDAKVVNCSVTGTLYPPYDWENSSPDFGGGVVSFNYGTVERCSFSGTLYNMSGIAGENNGTIKDCYSTGVCCYNACSGISRRNLGQIENSYTTMKGSDKVLGINSYSAADMCLYSYQQNDNNSLNIKFAEDLKKQATFENWDFENVWAIDSQTNGGFPYLRKPETRDIVYVTNGGTMPKYVDDKYTVGFAHGLSVPTKAGYSFDGWFLEPDFKTKITMVGSKDVGTRTLYAKWSLAYTVKFNANGGSGTMAAQTIARNVSTKLSANAFKKTGYVFTGWAKSKNGKVVYKNKQAVKNLAAQGKSITLYAQWTPIKYEVEFCWAKSDENTVYGMDRMHFTYGQTKQLPKCTIKGPKGKKFVGWSTTRNGPVKYKDRQKVKNLTTENKKVVVLYAVYK